MGQWTVGPVPDQILKFWAPVCELIKSGDGDVSIREALRRGEGLFWCCLDGRNKECCCCFRRFAADLLEIASSGSANAVPVLVVCNGFARNGALSNGNSGNPS